MVRTIRSAGQTLLDMIGEVLDVARIESEQPAPAIDFDLHALLASVRALLHHEARREGARLAARDRSRRALQPARRAALAAADPGQPDRQRDQVHRTTAASRCGCAARRSGAEHGDAADRGRRHRHRHSARGAGADLRALHPGRRVRPRGAMAAPASGSPSRASSARLLGGSLTVRERARAWAPASPCARPSRRSRTRRRGLRGQVVLVGAPGEAADYRRAPRGLGRRRGGRDQRRCRPGGARPGRAAARHAAARRAGRRPRMAPGRRDRRALRGRAAQCRGDR